MGDTGSLGWLMEHLHKRRWGALERSLNSDQVEKRLCAYSGSPTAFPQTLLPTGLEVGGLLDLIVQELPTGALAAVLVSPCTSTLKECLCKSSIVF